MDKLFPVPGFFGARDGPRRSRSIARWLRRYSTILDNYPFQQLHVVYTRVFLDSISARAPVEVVVDEETVSFL